MAINYNSQLRYDSIESYNSHRAYKSAKITHSKQFPEFFRDDYPAFVQFIDLYYQYLSSTYSGNIEHVLDIDRTDEIFLEKYRLQYAVDIPAFDNMEMRTFIRNAKQFYSAKGTANAVKYLFRLLFNDSVQIEHPGDYQMQPSGGRWVQDCYFTVNADNRLIVPEVPFTLVYKTSRGRFRYEIEKIEPLLDTGDGILENSLIRIYLNKQQKLTFDVGQLLYLETATGDEYCIGTLVQSPVKINIVDGGKYWKPGQLIRLSGQHKDTLIRVHRVDQNGSILQAECVEFGYTHSVNQIYHAHPFNKKPNQQSVDVHKTLESVTPISYRFSINIYDQILSSDVAVNITQHVQTYFVPDDQTPGDSSYAFTGYTGTSLIQSEYKLPDPRQAQPNEITLDMWNESQAIFYLEFADVTKHKGYYYDDSGIIQNQQIRIQDNHFYQKFQYLIETKIDQQKFKQFINLVHPIGTAWFQTMLLEFNASNVIQPYAHRSISVTTNVTDNYFYADNIPTKHMVKPIYDQTALTDMIQKSANKYITDNYSLTHVDDYTTVIKLPYSGENYYSSTYAYNREFKLDIQ